MGIFNWGQNKKVKNVIAQCIAQSDNVPVSQVDSSRVDIIFDALGDENRKNMVKQFEEHGEELTVAVYRIEIEKVFVPLRIITLALAKAMNIPENQVDRSRVKNALDILDESTKIGILKQIKEYGEEAVVLWYSQQFEQAWR